MKLFKTNLYNCFIAILFLVVMLFATGKASAENVEVFSDDFNNETGGISVPLTKWDITGAIDISWPGGWDPYPGNGGYVVIDMASYWNATITTKDPITLTPGMYQLSFDLGTNDGSCCGWDGGYHGDNELRASFGSVFSADFPAPYDDQTPMEPKTYQFTITEETTAKLQFQEIGPDGAYGSILDNVLLEFIAPLNIDVDLDISPNKLNVKSQGVLPVVIFGTEDLDVTTVDTDAITLVDVAPLRSAIEDVNDDGFDDLTLKFDTQDMLQAIEVAIGHEVEDGEEIILVLTGSLLDGTSIIGEDDVVILKKGKGKK